MSDAPSALCQRPPRGWVCIRIADHDGPCTTYPDTATDPADLIERACEVMHVAYERAAALSGWSTHPDLHKPWAGIPEANKQTMRAAIGELLVWLDEDED